MRELTITAELGANDERVLTLLKELVIPNVAIYRTEVLVYNSDGVPPTPCTICTSSKDLCLLVSRLTSEARQTLCRLIHENVDDSSELLLTIEGPEGGQRLPGIFATKVFVPKEGYALHLSPAR